MAYNPYGNNPYGAPPAYGGYPGSSNAPPGMAPPPGLGPPPGMSSAPGMAPPGVQQSSAQQANRPSGLPPSFQAPANMPNINFNAPVIRLGTSQQGKSGAPTGGRDMPGPNGGRPGLGMERGMDRDRGAREAPQVLISEGVGGDDGIQRLLGAVGKLRKWDSAVSVTDDHKGVKFGFALFDDPWSLSSAVKLLHEEQIDVPVKRQPVSVDGPKDDTYEGIEKTKLQVTVDESSLKYLKSYEDAQDDSIGIEKLEAARAALKHAVRDLFYPKTNITSEDITMGNTESGENVEVVNIPLAQEDELADIPAEMREVVAQEIAAFRERSTQRDLERLRKEEEMEEMERRRNGPSRTSRLESPPASTNNIPLGPRGSIANAPSGPKGQNGQNRVAFVNGGISNTDLSIHQEDDDTDASDEELYRRYKSKKDEEDDKAYLEAERKWSNRERSRQAAIDRERERERQDAESFERRKEEQLEREKAWDDEKEAGRKTHQYYRDHSVWARKRAADRADEEAQDEADRRAEHDEQRREKVEMERARGMADSFLDKQAEELEEERQAPTATAPQPFKLSLGAAAQKAQASRAAPQRRTIAEVEVRAFIRNGTYDGRGDLASSTIPRPGNSIGQGWSLGWSVKWDYMDGSVIKDKLRPFVEKKIVEYLGVQEEMLVEAVEEHLRAHGTAAALVEELEGALDDEAEDLVKKLWRMVIFFTESEKRGLPA
ncbi:U1 snRNP-associated protein usp107 [Fusarium culmorum]|uniref:U1 snRNP-associated protein usp107 n=1 Tax=Fusarium culmorum TaxID=5516 RepID=A0A2T4GJH2_FUSCU|nr:U1 snRNP-associated protein usp107 [Fusarium culmorum]